MGVRLAFGISLCGTETNSASLVVTAYGSLVTIRNLSFTRIRMRLDGCSVKRFGAWERSRPDWEGVAELSGALPGVVRIGYERVAGVKICVGAAAGGVAARSAHVTDLLVGVPLPLEADDAVPVLVIKMLRLSLELVGERDGERERSFSGRVRLRNQPLITSSSSRTILLSAASSGACKLSSLAAKTSSSQLPTVSTFSNSCCSVLMARAGRLEYLPRPAGSGALAVRVSRDTCPDSAWPCGKACGVLCGRARRFETSGEAMTTSARRAKILQLLSLLVCLGVNR